MVVLEVEDLWVDEAAGAEEAAAAALCWTASICCSSTSSSLDCESWVTIGIILWRDRSPQAYAANMELGKGWKVSTGSCEGVIVSRGMMYWLLTE